MYIIILYVEYANKVNEKSNYRVCVVYKNYKKWQQPIKNIHSKFSVATTFPSRVRLNVDRKVIIGSKYFQKSQCRYQKLHFLHAPKIGWPNSKCSWDNLIPLLRVVRLRPEAPTWARLLNYLRQKIIKSNSGKKIHSYLSSSGFPLSFEAESRWVATSGSSWWLRFWSAAAAQCRCRSLWRPAEIASNFDNLNGKMIFFHTDLKPTILTGGLSTDSVYLGGIHISSCCRCRRL